MASNVIIAVTINLVIIILLGLRDVDAQSLRVGRGIADMTGLVSEGALVGILLRSRRVFR